LGFVFGLVRGAVIVCLIFLIIQWAIDDEPKPRWIAEAHALPLVEKGAEMLVALVPENIRSDADRAAAAARRKAEDEFKQKALERLTSPPPKDTNTNSNAPDQESGYTDAQRREMLKAIRGNQ
jgi:membrane protein required for colicin V production